MDFSSCRCHPIASPRGESADRFIFPRSAGHRGSPCRLRRNGSTLRQGTCVWSSIAASSQRKASSRAPRQAWAHGNEVAVDVSVPRGQRRECRRRLGLVTQIALRERLVEERGVFPGELRRQRQRLRRLSPEERELGLCQSEPSSSSGVAICARRAAARAVSKSLLAMAKAASRCRFNALDAVAGEGPLFLATSPPEPRSAPRDCLAAEPDGATLCSR